MNFRISPLLAATVAVSLSLAGCSKEDIPLAVETSTLSGTVSPLGSVSLVTATAPNGATVTAIPDASTGVYTLAGLLVGTSYALSYTPTSNYVAPIGTAATPVAGTITVVPPVTLSTSATATAASFAVELETLVNGNAFQLNTPYTKADGQTFTPTKFKYLLSNIRLTRADGSTYAVPESYYLVDAAVTSSSHFVVDNVPVGNYTGMSFLVGVDSVRNFSGAQTGALDAGNDLFWSWSQGYVFLKLEGTSALSPASGGALVYHVGSVPNIRTVAPAFGAGVVLPVLGGHIPEVHLSVNPLAVLQNTAVPANNIDFTTTYNVMGGSVATQLADNYAAGMFTLEHIHPN